MADQPPFIGIKYNLPMTLKSKNFLPLKINWSDFTQNIKHLLNNSLGRFETWYEVTFVNFSKIWHIITKGYLTLILYPL